MKKHTFLLFFVLPLLVSWHPHAPKTLKAKNLLGPVKTVIENVRRHMGERMVIVQHYNRQGQLIEARLFEPPRQIEMIMDSIPWSTSKFGIDRYRLDTNELICFRNTLYTYSATGKMHSERNIWVSRPFGEYRKLFYYDAQDSLKSEHSYSYDSLKQITDSGSTYYYYSYQKNSIEKRSIYQDYLPTFESDSSRTKWVYNEHNQMIEQYWFSGDNTNFGKAVYRYNEKGQLDRTSNYVIDSLIHQTELRGILSLAYHENGKIAHSELLKYYGNGILEKRGSKDVFYDSNTSVVMRDSVFQIENDTVYNTDIFEYDAQFNLTKWDNLKDGVPENQENVHYTYDRYSNWTTVIRNHADRKPDTTKRLILYYE